MVKVVVVVVALALAPAVGWADSSPARAVDRPLALPVGQVEGEAAIGASNAEGRDGEPATFGSWMGLRARAGAGLSPGLEVAGEALIALVRPYEAAIAGSLEGPYEQPLHAFGGVQLEVRYAWSARTAIQLRGGVAWPGAFGRGPLSEPDYRRLGDERSSTGMTLAYGLGFIFRLPIDKDMACYLTPALFMHERARIGDEAFATYLSLQLPVAFAMQFEPWLGAGLSTAFYKATGESIIPSLVWLQLTPEARFDVALELGWHYRAPEYSDAESHAFAGVTLRARRF